ncbi:MULTISPECIES: hypothetical protein [Myroides]|uniref:Uncharacterized protein n=1 Tax=Myroides albus TaxID=2562892 RepID=A0A6I3LI80_9FLAO|nr:MULTISPECIES: hypothetical protein [Myroides]MTG97547.1 hypothetical protein [Myroides albus]MVX35071.1 hypothetical protein [Myroides sp. LoEW2-1]UVD81176.1 hypothetical protein NWE55_08055 [Myroides albus]
MRNHLALFYLLIVCTTLQAQVHIPFRLTSSNNIILKTLVNQRDSLDLMFQLAMDDGAISPIKTHVIESIAFDSNDFSPSNQVQIGNCSWFNIPFANNQYSGKESDGKIGMTLFKGKVLEIDYDNSTLIAHDHIPDTTGYSEIPVSYRNGALFIDITTEIDKHTYTHPFYLQSGYSGALLYDDNFSEQNTLHNKLTTINQKELKNSYGQSIITNTALIDKLEIANYEIKNAKVGYFTGELKNQPFSLFGADMLKRFNWIINADRTMAWIKPSKYYGDTFLEL